MKKLSQKLKQMQIFRTKVTVLFFGVTGVFVLFFIGYFLYCQALVAKDPEDLLPAKNLVFLAEFSREDLADFLSRNKAFRTYFFDPFLQQYFNQNLTGFNAQAKTWLGDKMAFAKYKADKSAQDEIYYLILENNNQRKALDFMRDLGLKGEPLQKKEYKNSDILSFSQSLNVSCSFLYGYLICSNQAVALEKIIDLNESESGFLSGSTDYNKVKNNLPQTAGGAIYFDTREIAYGDLEPFVGSLQKYLKKGGIAFRQTTEGIRLNSYLSLEKGLVSSGASVLKNNLESHLVAADLGVYLSGVNLTRDFQQILQVWDVSSPYFSVIIEGMLRARVAEYFGSVITLEEDLYPLFKDGYALAMRFVPIPQIDLVLEVRDQKKAELILKKMLKAFYIKNESLKSGQTKKALPDGFVLKEAMTDESQLQKTQIKWNGVPIYSVVIKDAPFSFNYAIADQKVFFSTNVEGVKENLALEQSPAKSLAQSSVYQKARNLMFLNGEEKSFFDLKALDFLSLFDSGERFTTLFSDFHYAFISTKWFDDGMANEVIFLK